MHCHNLDTFLGKVLRIRQGKYKIHKLLLLLRGNGRETLESMNLTKPNTIFLISLHEGDCLRAVIHIAKNEMPGAKLPTVC